MRTEQIVTMLLVVAALSLVTILALRVQVGATADRLVILSAGGMTCESCADKIRTALEREKGVAATEIDVSGGWVVVGFDSRVTRPELLIQRVATTGYAATLHSSLSPEQFRQLTGRTFGNSGEKSGGCCGSKEGGCSVNRQQNPKETI